MSDKGKRIGCIALIGLFLCAMQFFFGGGREYIREILSGRSRIGKESPLIVLDAGHGGFDPGKVGTAGTLEKEINLAVVQELKELLEQNDIRVILTRTDDEGLYSESDKNKKTADMRARVAVLDEAAPLLAVSIHQNSFTDSASRGAQVFYYEDSEVGKQLAETIQEAVKRELGDGNHRVAKPNSSYYMLKKSSCPLVIVECGFLSNPEEEQLLRTPEYQRKMAYAIHLGILEWLNHSAVSMME